MNSTSVGLAHKCGAYV